MRTVRGLASLALGTAVWVGGGAGFGPSAHAAEDSERAPVIWMTFDEGLDDGGPHRFRGTVHGDGVSRAPGRRGQALSIGGTEDWLDVDLRGVPSLENGASLVMWIRRDDWTNPYKGGSGWQTLASIDTGFSLSITAPGCPLHEPWALQGSADHYREDVKEFESAYALSRPDSVRAERWQHVGLVYDPGQRTLSLYLDGERVDQARAVAPPGLRRQRLRIGTWYKANQAFRGLVDELAVYDYPLSANAVARAAAPR